MSPGNLAGDNCEGPIAPAVPFDPVGMDKHGVGHAAPFAHKPRASLQRNRWRGASLSTGSTFKRSSLRRIDLERPPSGLSWSL
jgi:hypothetical protein